MEIGGNRCIDEKSQCVGFGKAKILSQSATLVFCHFYHYFRSDLKAEKSKPSQTSAQTKVVDGKKYTAFNAKSMTLPQLPVATVTPPASDNHQGGGPAQPRKRSASVFPGAEAATSILTGGLRLGPAAAGEQSSIAGSFNNLLTAR